MKAKTKHHDRQQLLMQAFNFRASDLKANQSGKLSQRQIQLYMLKQISPLIFGTIISFLLTVPIILIILWVNPKNLVAGFVLFAIYSPSIALGITVSFRLRRIRRQSFIRNEMNYRRVARVQGLTIVDISNSSRSYYGKLKVNNCIFRLQHEELLCVKHLEPHIVYYLPKSKIIVSVEAMQS